MKSFLAILGVAVALTFLTDASHAQGKVDPKVRDECRAMWGGSHNYQKRTRTGMTVELCIRQRSGGR